MSATRGAVIALALTACTRAEKSTASGIDAQASAATNPASPIAADAAAPSPAVDAVAPDTSAVDASAPDASAPLDGTLTLEVRGGYCPAEKQNAPGCRSYTYALGADGKLTGARRKSDVPRAEVEALFRAATAAFDAPHTCIPNAPDRGSQALTLRSNGKTRAARGGCGRAFEDVKARLEKLASES